MYIQEIIEFLKEHIILSVTWIFLLIIIISIFINDWKYRLFQISHNKAIFLINKKNATIIDIRDHNEFLKGHIINSINISIKNIKNNNCLKLKKSKKTPLIIAHENGILSNTIIKNFKELGFEDIYILHGGINSWKTENLPLVLKTNH